MSTADDARAYAVTQGASLIGEPYRWGGEDSEEGGYDCSGLMHEILERVGAFWPVLAIPRLPARGIFAHFSRLGCPSFTDPTKLKPGSLTFFRKPAGSIFHVKLHVATLPPERGSTEQAFPAIDAGGGGSRTTTLAAALRSAACVRHSSSIHHTRGSEWIGIDPFALLTR